MTTRSGRRGQAVEVSVPATSANLGPGYDSLGLALNMRDRVNVAIQPGGTRVDVHGEGAGQVAVDDTNLVVSSIRTTFNQIGFPQPGLAVESFNQIPHGRGLGSSAAAIVAGVAAAHALAGSCSSPESTDVTDVSTDPDVVFAAAAAIEGHPDNVAACVYGGLTISWSAAEGPRATRLEVSASVSPVLVVLDARLSTKSARALLPERVEHAQAATNLARSALLVAVLSGQSPVRHLLDATDDRLHQPYRADALPRTSELVAALRSVGVAAVVSGAGPSVLALVTGPSQLQTVRELAGARARVLPLSVDRDGLQVHRQPSSR